MKRHDRELLAARLETIAATLDAAEDAARVRSGENGIPLEVVDVYVAAAVRGAVADAVRSIRWEAQRVKPKRRRVARTVAG